jgi:ankyrin repeat protein
MKRYLIPGLSFWAFGGLLPAQTPAKVDFKRDVLPIFREYCIGCHGPAQQLSGFRLDRRRDAMRGGGGVAIGPGSSASSRLYLRLIGNQYGPQMPPTGPLSREQINIIKAWIDQGAEWPDDASGERASTPPDPKAARMMQALRTGDRQTFEKTLRENSEVAKRKGPGGSTPLMYAALYGDARSVRLLLENGADPNVKNDVGATALMWAVEDLEKTRLLIEHGADPNSHSDDGSTPLIIAANWFGSSPILKLLIDHGADPSAQSPLRVSALDQAAQVGDDAAIRLLLERGVDKKKAGPQPLAFAIWAGCAKCVEMLIDSADRNTLSGLLGTLMPPELSDGHNVQAARMLLDRGADANGFQNPLGLAPLMRASSSDIVPVEMVQALIEHGADVNAKGNNGETALSMARLRGQTAVVELLKKAGAAETSPPEVVVVKPSPAASIRAAVQRSIPLLQKADVTFVEKSGCVSCHNNALTLMTLATAEKYGIPVERQAAQQQLARIRAYLEARRERTLQSQTIQGGVGPVSYILAGLAARNYPADETTDAYARYLKSKQTPDGRWLEVHRPPLDSGDIGPTARAIRALQAYAPKLQRAEYDKSIRLAAAWLEKAQPLVTDDRAFQLLGLNWAGTSKETIRRVGRGLVAQQRPDGGWAQLPTLSSDAYATGEVLVALREAGILAVTDAAYQRGVKFLLSTQLEDGSWYVKSRSIPFQPYFESGFPHGHDQWISVAATNWAVMALAPAVEQAARASR